MAFGISEVVIGGYMFLRNKNSFKKIHLPKANFGKSDIITAFL